MTSMNGPAVTVPAAAPPAPRSTAPTGCSAMLLRRLTRRVSRHYDGYLSPCGLKTTQYSLLSVVASQGPLSPGEIARILSLDASSLTRNLRPLLAAGWVTQDAGDDARRRRVSITPAGLLKRQEARALWKQAQREFSRRIGPGRVDALHRLIDTCQSLLDESVEAPGETA